MKIREMVRSYSLRNRKTGSKAEEAEDQPLIEPGLAACGLDTDLFNLTGRTVDAKVVKVIDGDSLHIVFYFDGAYRRFVCRIEGVDTPEKTSKDAIERQRAMTAKEKVTGLVLNKIVTAKLGRFDKFGRLLVDVNVPDVGRSLSEYIIVNNLGRAYDGGHKDTWDFAS